MLMCSAASLQMMLRPCDKSLMDTVNGAQERAFILFCCSDSGGVFLRNAAGWVNGMFTWDGKCWCGFEMSGNWLKLD